LRVPPPVQHQPAGNWQGAYDSRRPPASAQIAESAPAWQWKDRTVEVIDQCHREQQSIHDVTLAARPLSVDILHRFPRNYFNAMKSLGRRVNQQPGCLGDAAIAARCGIAGVACSTRTEEGLSGTRVGYCRLINLPSGPWRERQGVPIVVASSTEQSGAPWRLQRKALGKLKIPKTGLHASVRRWPP
jgi:hypothetical protein